MVHRFVNWLRYATCTHQMQKGNFSPIRNCDNFDIPWVVYPCNGYDVRSNRSLAVTLYQKFTRLNKSPASQATRPSKFLFTVTVLAMTRLKLSLTTSRVQILVYSGHRKRRRFSSVGLGVVRRRFSSVGGFGSGAFVVLILAAEGVFLRWVGLWVVHLWF